MKNIKKRFLFYGLVILILYLFVIPPINISAEDEAIDYTEYTDYDENSNMTITETKVDVDMIEITDNSGLYYDYGASYFNTDWSFEWEYTLRYENVVFVNSAAFMVLCNTVNPGTIDLGQITSVSTTPDHIGFFVGHSAGPTMSFGIFERVANTSYTASTTIDLNEETYMDTKVYVSGWFDDSEGTYGTMYLELFSDSDRLSKIGSTKSLALTEENSWRYLHQYMSQGAGSSGTPNDISFDLENSYIMGESFSIVTGSEPDSIEYLWETSEYEITFSANTTEPGEIYGAVSLDEETWYPFIMTSQGANEYTGSTFIDDTYEEDTVYYYVYGYATDDEEYAETSEYSFILERSETGLPSISLSQQDVGIDTQTYGGVDVPIWWQLDDDGGETCNVTIAYNTAVEAALGNWYYAGNTTANTSDSGYATVNMTVEDIWFICHAQATNSAGTVNSTDLYFIWWNADQPEVFTLQPDNMILYTMPGENVYCKVDLNGTVTDGGGAYCVVGFRLRQNGATSWEYFYKGDDYGDEYWVSEGNNFTSTIYGLLPNINYEYSALISNESLYNPVYYNYTYLPGNTVTFHTLTGNDYPSVSLNSVVYWDDYTVKMTGALNDDGGYPCIVTLMYRSIGGGWYAPNPGSAGYETGDSITGFIPNLDYGQEYEFIIKAYNGGVGLGGHTSYSNIISFQLVAPDDTTTPEPGTDLSEPIDDFLIQVGLFSEGGKLLVVIVAMLLVVIVLVFIPGNNWKNHLNVTLPIAGIIDAIILVYGMVIKYVPVWATVIIVVVFAVIIARFVTQIVGARRAD